MFHGFKQTIIMRVLSLKVGDYSPYFSIVSRETGNFKD